MDIAYFNLLSTIVTYYQARTDLAYPVPPFQWWLASTNAATVTATNVNEKCTVNQSENNPTTSESSDDAQTTKTRMKWNYGETSTLILFWKNNIGAIESPISNNV